MAKYYRVQTSLHTDSGLDRDDVVNVLHFRDENVVPDPEGLAARMETFYTANPTGQANGISDFLSPYMAGTADVKVYDLEDAEPRVPVAIDSFTYTPETNAPLPAEVAICLSFQGEPVSGQNQGRRRGRIYLGEFSVLAIDGVTPGDTIAPAGPARPSTTLRTIMVTALGDLLEDAPTSLWQLCVFSPTTLAEVGATIDDAFTPVVEAWVDNDFDTVRARSAPATSRVTYGPL